MGQRQFGLLALFRALVKRIVIRKYWSLRFRSIKEQSELGWLGVFVCHTTDGRNEDGASIG